MTLASNDRTFRIFSHELTVPREEYLLTVCKVVWIMRADILETCLEVEDLKWGDFWAKSWRLLRNLSVKAKEIYSSQMWKNKQGCVKETCS